MTITDKKIRSVATGYGQGAVFRYVGEEMHNGKVVDKIVESVKILGKGYYNDLTMTVYFGYDKDGNMLFATTSGPNVEVQYM